MNIIFKNSIRLSYRANSALQSCLNKNTNISQLKSVYTKRDRDMAALV